MRFLKFHLQAQPNTFKKNDLTNTELKEKYGVGFIVRGNIQGNSDKLRVTAEMTDVAKNAVIWS